MFTSSTPPRRPNKRERANIDRIRFGLPLDIPVTVPSDDGLTAKERKARRNGWDRHVNNVDTTSS